ncbi:MAG: RNA polymerase sigma factor [Bacteroidetes bacterium]|nr:RNA polymerase sigma factor [Bacteroidota bacterium]HET6244134.1 RNA polymerase sigma factor [Bacteroidia bacterium]
MSPSEYNTCVDAYSDNLYRFILKNIKDKDKAKDIVQDTYEKLWINCSELEFSKAKSWMFTTGYRTMIDLLRREKKQGKFDETDLSVFSHEKNYSDLQEILHHAINKLPADQKAVVMLRDYEGYSYEEISGITGLSEAQVKVYIFRARTFLKKYLGSIETLV